MPAKKSAKPSKSVATKAPQSPDSSSALSTVAGPSSAPIAATGLDGQQEVLAIQKNGTNALAAAMPFNPLKDGEHGLESGHEPSSGEPAADPPHPIVGASTVAEGAQSEKIGDGVVEAGKNATVGSLDRVRVDSTGQVLTTNMGARVADNQNSLKAGLRGPTLLEDFILREKITHFDHERIPERIVHARGSAAHGFFESSESLSDITRAAPFQEAGTRTPVFVRFSTVAGERGSADTVRDVRGFAVKFYTTEGNWDIVGNNIPVFFIQDAMKFPDLVHAVKPEPHHAMPQASSAHDTFWDFVSLMPESAHMLMWVMSDRAIPRSYRMMQGFGVHTFRLVNADGDSVFCKFHWNPVAGTHSLVWDEAVKIAGGDADYHRRDLWEAIEAGEFPQWDLGLQIFTEETADTFTFDVLDATKLIPEELVPIRTVGRLTLNRNPDNFFAETEQVAFGTQNVIPGIDFSNDPLLAGRIHSYFDTQLSRLGGPNFHEIPINTPVAQVHNNQRDGMHRQAVHRGRVSYEPNSLGGGCPYQAGKMGFVPFPQPVFEDKVRGKPEKFADHYSQASLFFRSQSAVEQTHIINAFRFELTRVQTNAVRERVLSVLANVDSELAQAVADGLGMPVPDAQPRALDTRVESEVEMSPALSLFSRPGSVGVRTRRVALLVADGVDDESLKATYTALQQAGAVPRVVGARLGTVTGASGNPVHVEVTLETAPSVMWDASVLPDGEAAIAALAAMGPALEFMRDQYRHCKPILVNAAGSVLLAKAGIPVMLPDGSADPGIIGSAKSNAK
ncbi:MAG: catalase, partial [Phycisphaerae bacterium]|nr:catalase [Gemmatimonadaceae bacterium]